MDDQKPTPSRPELGLRLRTTPALRRMLPVRLDVASAELRGGRAWRRNPAAREDALRATAAIVGASERAGELESLARRRLIEANLYEVLFWRPWRPPELDERSRENLAAAVARGRGVLLSGCHLGPFFLCMSAVATVHRAPVGMVGPWLLEQTGGRWGRRTERWRNGIAQRGELMLPTGGAFERIVALLAQGELVRVHFDMPGSVETSFLGKPAELAGGTARLAKLSEAPVLTIHTRRIGDEVLTSIGAPLDPRDYPGSRELHEELARIHERAILETPEQLEDPNRPGAWAGGATAEVWRRAPADPG
jgi:lauroyl/myristoyl acyltransferase